MKKILAPLFFAAFALPALAQMTPAGFTARNGASVLMDTDAALV